MCPGTEKGLTVSVCCPAASYDVIAVASGHTQAGGGTSHVRELTRSSLSLEALSLEALSLEAFSRSRSLSRSFLEVRSKLSRSSRSLPLSLSKLSLDLDVEASSKFARSSLEVRSKLSLARSLSRSSKLALEALSPSIFLEALSLWKLCPVRVLVPGGARFFSSSASASASASASFLFVYFILFFLFFLFCFFFGEGLWQRNIREWFIILLLICSSFSFQPATAASSAVAAVAATAVSKKRWCFFAMSFNISVTGKMEDGSLLRAAGSWSTTDGKQSGRFELRFSPPPAGSPSLPNVPMPGRFQFLFFNEEEDRVFPELRHGEACFEKIIGRGTDAQSNVRGFFCNSAPDSSAEDSAATAAAAAESIDKTIKLVGTFFPTTEDGALVQLTVLRNVPEEDLDQWVAQYRGIEQRLHMRAALAAQLKAERDAAALKEKLAAERRRRRKPTVSATVGYGSVSAAPAAASSSAAASSVQTALGSVNSRKGGAAVSSATNSASGTSSAEPSKSRKAKAPRDASTEAAPSAKDALASTLATEVSAARPPVKRARKIRRSANSGLSRMLKPKFVGIQTSHPVVLLLGPPGVGKGTQGMLLQQYLVRVTAAW